MWLFEFKKYVKFWRVLVGHFIKHNNLLIARFKKSVDPTNKVSAVNVIVAIHTLFRFFFNFGIGIFQLPISWVILSRRNTPQKLRICANLDCSEKQKKMKPHWTINDYFSSGLFGELSFWG